MDTAFDIGQPVWQILTIIFFVLPGLNATWIIERLAGPTALKGTERLLRAVGLSVFLYALASPWLLRIARRISLREFWIWEPILGGIVLVLIAPLVLGIGWTKLKRGARLRRWVGRLTKIDPAPTSWDYVFSRGGPFWLRIRLKSGEQIGGLFGPNSNASLYPEPQDVYLEQAWKLDPTGRFEAAVEDSRGILVRAENIEMLELISIDELGAR